MNYMDGTKSPVECNWHFLTPDTKAGRKIIKRCMRKDFVCSADGWKGCRGTLYDAATVKNTVVKDGKIFVPVYESCEFGKHGNENLVELHELAKERWRPTMWCGMWGIAREQICTSRSGILGPWHWKSSNAVNGCAIEQREYYEKAQKLKAQKEYEEWKALRNKVLERDRDIRCAFKERGGKKSRKQKQLIALGIPA